MNGPLIESRHNSVHRQILLQSPECGLTLLHQKMGMLFVVKSLPFFKNPRIISKYGCKIFAWRSDYVKLFAPASTASLAKCESAGTSTSGSSSFAITALAGSILEPIPPATKTASSTTAIVYLTTPFLSSVAPYWVGQGRKGRVEMVCHCRNSSCWNYLHRFIPKRPLE